jgi:hypothetical protein
VGTITEMAETGQVRVEKPKLRKNRPTPLKHRNDVRFVLRSQRVSAGVVCAAFSFC